MVNIKLTKFNTYVNPSRPTDEKKLKENSVSLGLSRGKRACKHSVDVLY
jgi:hypothetical protein